MKKILSALAISATLVTPAVAWEDTTEMNQQIDQTNFIVGQGCSGTLISVTDRLILTAHHCIDQYIRKVTREETDEDGTVKKVTYEKRDRVTVAQKDYDRYEQVGAIAYQTEIIGYRHERDLALLQLVGDNLRSQQASPILHASTEVMRGDDVWVVGNPYGLDATVTSGVISNMNRTFEVPWALSERVPMIQFDADVNPGNSGGSLYNDDGVLIGVVVAGIRGTNLELAVPIFELYPLLDTLCYAELYDPQANDAECKEKKKEEKSENESE